MRLNVAEVFACDEYGEDFIMPTLGKLIRQSLDMVKSRPGRKPTQVAYVQVQLDLRLLLLDLPPCEAIRNPLPQYVPENLPETSNDPMVDLLNYLDEEDRQFAELAEWRARARSTVNGIYDLQRMVCERFWGAEEIEVIWLLDNDSLQTDEALEMCHMLRRKFKKRHANALMGNATVRYRAMLVALRDGLEECRAEEMGLDLGGAMIGVQGKRHEHADGGSKWENPEWIPHPLLKRHNVVYLLG